MKRFWHSAIAIFLLVVWAGLAGGIHFYIESLWFDSVGFWEVFGTMMMARFNFFIAGFLLSFAFLALNAWLTFRRPPGAFWLKPEMAAMTEKGTRTLFIAVAAGLSLLAGMALQGSWLTVLQFLNRVDAGNVDPIFGHDIGFYFFSLPAYELASTFALLLAAAALILSAISYVLHGHLGYEDRLRLTKAARVHLTVLIACVFSLLAVRFWLIRFEILFDAQGAVFGAGYADLNAWLPCYWVLSILAAATAVLFLVSLAVRTLKLAGATGIGFVLAYLALNLYPSFIQTFVVAPNELEKETPFIQHNINSTLDAYNLADIEVHDFSADQVLDEPALVRNQNTLKNIRLWDWRPLKDAYGQLQSIRLYYEFQDADIDRYVINGEYRQVMLSIRELDFSKISESAQNWINQHFQYTHGQGLCLSPVNEVTPEGLPEFFIQDIPPRSNVDLGITRPEIYFGEKTDYPVFVRTQLEEFDYPIGDQNATTTYQADRGISIGSYFRRLMLAWELGSYQILFTDYFTDESRILMHRRIQDRIPKIAPFLRYDDDPYPVIHEGRLFWMQDAFTITNRYPYSEPYPDKSTGYFNYIRNSVKVVVDAYLGDVTFYIADESDPLIRVYASIFPEMFRPLSEMPDGLRSHIRYPADFFDVQRHMYGRYHMKDPTVFYNQEDAWEIPTEIYGGNEQMMESYYVIMSLPGEDQEEFILLIPFTPRNKNNMVGWLAARSDGENYGKLVLYQFPKQELTYGPMQIEARIDQNPEISQLITLWSQKGSRVIRGNLLIIPIEDSLLYVEPLYLQAEKSEIPELTRIIVVYRSQVALAETLEQALAEAVIGEGGRLDSLALSAPRELPAPTTIEVGTDRARALFGEALQHYERSQQLLKQGDWAGYGREQEQLGKVLRQLRGEE